MNPSRIYLDHAATTPILPEVAAVIAGALADWANPSSQHADGRRARAALEDARGRVARALGWQGEVIFTGGATEALAIGWRRSRGSRKFASAVEHPAVLRLVEKEDVLLPVGADGLVRPEALPEADLWAIQQVNNETGVIQPLEAIAGAARAKGALWLADCAQGAGKQAFAQAGMPDADLPDADLIAIAGHKVGGPPGVGALLVRDVSLLEPTGGQERGYRPGTENLPYILGLAAALEAPRDWVEEAAFLRAWFEQELRGLGVGIIGEGSPRLPTIGAYRIAGMNASLVLIRADVAGIAISAGSACSSGSLKPSHVPVAMGFDEAAAREVFRVSIGRSTTREDLEALLAVIGAIAGARKVS